MSSSKPKTHIVAVPLPAQGHMSPMLHLCKFIERDPAFTVSFISLREEFVKNWEAPAGFQEIRLLSIPFSRPPSPSRGFGAEALSHLGSWFSQAARELPPAFENLIRELNQQGPPVRYILSDYSLEWTQDVADLFGIPRIVLWPGNAAWTTLDYHIPELLERGHIFPSKGRASEEEANSTIVDYVRGIAPLRVADLPSYMLVASEGQELLKEICVQRSPVIKRASWVLVNSFYDLEASTFDFMASELGPKFIPAGPMFLLDDSATDVKIRPENTDCLRWLDEQEPRSVLYISFGSIAVLSVEQFEELAAALEASKKPFLWVIRSDLVVGSSASTESYNGFLERTKDQGFVVSWAPQLRVLSHPSLGAFLTHCGWNSILESMSNGIPLLGWPSGAEQNTNCKLVVEDWKIGVRFSKTALEALIEREEIEAGIRKVMDGEEGKSMKERVMKLKSLARQAVDKQHGRSLKGLQACLEDLKSE